MLRSITRRNLVSSIASGVVALVGKQSRARTQSRPAIGAIRWDTWYSATENEQRLEVETTLGPKDFQGRAPDFAIVTSDDTITISGYSQSQIDREITLAHAAGLDFWAYCFYELEKPIMNAWKMHQESRLRNQMKWCLILSSYYFESLSVIKDSQRYISYMLQTNYQTSPDGRPLIFVLSTKNSSAEHLKIGISRFREACARTRLSDPYISLMGWEPASTRSLVTRIGGDAVSAYSIASPPRQETFADLDRAVRAEWAAMARTGVPCIPLAVTGKDRRPRVRHPVFWEAWRQKAMDGYDRYYEAGRPEEIAAQIRAMIDWIKFNASICVANCGLIYSWNECDEGGSTLLPTLGQGDAILRAVGRVLRPD
jgi:hypothetical protein